MTGKNPLFQEKAASEVLSHVNNPGEFGHSGLTSDPEFTHVAANDPAL